MFFTFKNLCDFVPSWLSSYQETMISRRILKLGRHSVRWDGKDEQQHKLASGVYLYRVEMSAAKTIVGGKTTLAQ